MMKSKKKVSFGNPGLYIGPIPDLSILPTGGAWRAKMHPSSFTNQLTVS